MIQNQENNLAWSLIGNLPFSIGAAFASFSASTMILLLLGRFDVLNVVTIGLPVSLAVFYLVNKRIKPTSLGTTNERRVFDVIAIVFILGWIGFNVQYTSQNVYLYRDPGLYNVTARWLMSNDELIIPATNPFGDNENLHAKSNAGIQPIKEDPTRLYPHGLHLLPAMSALLGRIFNESVALKINVLFGGMALLAVYGFARIIARPRWAFLGTAALSLSLPMLYFSRDMFTEPLSMLFIFTGFGLLHYAYRNKNTLLWGVSGLLFGASLLTRVDAYLGLLGPIIFIVYYLVNSKKTERKSTVSHVTCFIAGVLFIGGIGWLDLTQLSQYYYRFHDELIALQISLLVAVLIVGIVATVVNWQLGMITRMVQRTLAWRWRVGVIIGLIILAVLWLRPAILQEVRHYEIQNIGGTESIVSQDGPTVSSIQYDTERTLNWPIWYMGAFVSVLGLFGVLIMIKKVAYKNNEGIIPFLVTFIGLSALYFFKPSITPDHIWASRRFLPLIFPGLAILAAYALSQIKLKKVNGVAVYILVGILSLTPIIGSSKFFIAERTNTPLLDQVNVFCAVLPENAAVVEIGIMGLVGVQTVSSYCEVPTVRYLGSPTQDEFKGFYDNAVKNNRTPVVAAFDQDKFLLPEGSLIKQLDPIIYNTVEKKFASNPLQMVKTQKQIVYGLIGADGVVRN